MSVPPKGNVLPKLGKELPMSRRNGLIGYAPAIAEALTTELRGSNRAIKTVMKWTGASERTVNGPPPERGSRRICIRGFLEARAWICSTTSFGSV